VLSGWKMPSWREVFLGSVEGSAESGNGVMKTLKQDRRIRLQSLLWVASPHSPTPLHRSSQDSVR